MCGIFGAIIGKGEVAPILRDALKRLEYRGYDSVGVVTLNDAKLHIKKDKGKIVEVDERENLADLPGKLGLAHTRWATHGAPAKENAHPHTDCTGEVAVIHNGIIQNYLELKRELEAEGHVFASRTDTEVVPHLVESYMKKGHDVEKSFLRTLQRLKGAYALALVCSREPGKLFCGRRESPLVLGVDSGSVYCASDVPAFLPLTRTALFLEDGDMAVLSLNGLRVRDFRTGMEVEREKSTIMWDPESAKKSGYPHFTLKEILEQPDSLADALGTAQIYYDLMASKINEAKNVFLLACGTAYHASMVGAYALAKLAGLRAEAVVASEFSSQYLDLVGPDTCILAVSQSGETMDTLTAVREAKTRHARILGVTNVMGSSLTRQSEVYIGQNAGPEIGVAGTKSFTSQVLILNKLAMVLGLLRRNMSEKATRHFAEEMENLPSLVRQELPSLRERIPELAQKLTVAKSLVFLGRGVNVATALEGRLKFLELTYLPALAYPAGESKHGFISLVEEGFPTIFVAPRDGSRQRIIGNMLEMKARGAHVISIMEKGDREIESLSEETVEIGARLPETLSPILFSIPMQLLAYHTAVELGNDPDYPRNLAKSVTVE